MKQRVLIKQNDLGWFVAFPRWWGGYDVIEAIPTYEEAWAVYEHRRRLRDL